MKEIIEKSKLVLFLIGLTLAFNVLVFAQQTSVDRGTGPITAAEALSRYEKLLQDETEPLKKNHLTLKAATAALAAGETEKAKLYARAVLQEVKSKDAYLFYGDAIHGGNLVLGLVALDEGDVEEAKRCLLEAGKTPGSGPLNSFGPNMLLAKKLLEKGERDVVIQYFDLCAVFWDMHHERLDEWKAIVLKGKIPNFRANLVYLLSYWQYEHWDK